MAPPNAPSNPFHYGELVAGASFADRESELAELTRDIKAGGNVVVISPRRYGKTSLVQIAIEQVEADGVLVAYLDLFRTPTKQHFADRRRADSGAHRRPPERHTRALPLRLVHRTRRWPRSDRG